MIELIAQPWRWMAGLHAPKPRPKPRLVSCSFYGWFCFGLDIDSPIGIGLTPAAAYADWQRQLPGT